MTLFTTISKPNPDYITLYTQIQTKPWSHEFIYSDKNQILIRWLCILRSKPNLDHMTLHTQIQTKLWSHDFIYSDPNQTLHWSHDFIYSDPNQTLVTWLYINTRIQTKPWSHDFIHSNPKHILVTWLRFKPTPGHVTSKPNLKYFPSLVDHRAYIFFKIR